MAIQASDSSARNANKIVWEMPDDMRAVERIYPVTTQLFSIALLRHRFSIMDEEAQHRSIRVIDCLERKEFYEQESDEP